ncbi:type VII secretion integral membrane protein EccD [Nocardiopsis suaedae]|uniref:Type VII secretion integral membrane protein EccD n=1 Tax=Nocardiopsis suaedae TaxID=3018444 RepID=A0ABT4TNF6_9ACTN|nr:type VII secretion integral membrane protein EccD [Nocardiopsis suaedae]MDA2806235.1 type VII secretion integral membrane protein EccD [Nocardiopsis suaedae]
MSGYCRVKVAGPQRWADLALPGTVPVASLLPQVIEVCSPEADGTRPAGWALVDGAGAHIPPEGTLESAGVADGAVLALRPVTAPERPSHVDDVRGAVEDRVDGTGGIWDSSATFAFGLLLAGTGPLAVLAVMEYLRPWPGNIGVAAAGALFTLVLAVFAGRRRMSAVAAVLLGAACLWGAAVGVLAVLLFSGAQPLALAAFGLAGALLVAAVGWALDESGLAYLSALGVLTAAGGVLAGVGTFTDPAQGVRAASVALVLAVGALPRVALVMGGLSALDYEVRHSGQVETGRFEETLTSSDRLLLGLVLGTAVAGALTVPLLAAVGGGVPDVLLAALVAVLLVFRSRLFDRVRHALPLRLGGALGVGAAAVGAYGLLPALGPWLPALALAAGAVLALLSRIRLAEVPRASLRRTLNGIEIVAVVAVCAVLAWSMGLFALVARLTGSI